MVNYAVRSAVPFFLPLCLQVSPDSLLTQRPAMNMPVSGTDIQALLHIVGGGGGGGTVRSMSLLECSLYLCFNWFALYIVLDRTLSVLP